MDQGWADGGEGEGSGEGNYEGDGTGNDGDGFDGAGYEDGGYGDGAGYEDGGYGDGAGYEDGGYGDGAGYEDGGYGDGAGYEDGRYGGDSGYEDGDGYGGDFGYGNEDGGSGSDAGYGGVDGFSYTGDEYADGDGGTGEEPGDALSRAEEAYSFDHPEEGQQADTPAELTESLTESTAEEAMASFPEGSGIFFDYGERDWLFTDEEKAVDIHTEGMEGVDYSLVYTVGRWENNGFAGTMAEGNGWRKSDDGMTLYLDGAALSAAGLDRVEVRVRAVSGNDSRECQHGFDVREPWYGFEWSEELFPGEQRFITADDGGQRIPLSDKWFPWDGLFYRYRIEDVSVVESQGPGDEYDSRPVISFEKNDNGWQCTANRYGQVRLAFTLALLSDGGDVIETVTLEGEDENWWSVGGYRARIDLRSETGNTSLRPGESAVYVPYIWAERYDHNGAYSYGVDTADYLVEYEVEVQGINGEWLEAQGIDWDTASRKGKFYDWSVGGDGRTLTVTAKEDAPDMHLRIVAKAVQVEKGENGEPDESHEVARNDQHLDILSGTWLITLPDEWDRDLPVGASAVFSPQVKFFDNEHPNGETVQNEVDWEFDWYEGSGDIESDDIPQILITDADGRQLTYGEEGGRWGKAPFIIQRIAPWDVNFSVTASWDDDEGGFHVVNRRFDMDDAGEYGLEFRSNAPRGGDDWGEFFSACDVEITPELDEINALIQKGYPVEVTASYFRDRDENGNVRPIKTYDIDAEGRRGAETGEFRFAAGEFSDSGALTISANRYDEIASVLRYQDHEWGGGDPKFTINVKAVLNDILLAERSYEIRLKHGFRSMEDDGITLIPNRTCRYDGGYASFYVEDDNHCGGNDRDNRPGSLYDVHITDIRSSDISVLEPVKEGDDWVIYARQWGEADITYTFTGGPLGDEPDHHTTDMYVRNQRFLLIVQDEKGRDVEGSQAVLLDEEKPFSVRVIRQYFDDNNPGDDHIASEEVDPAHLQVFFRDYDNRIAAITEPDGGGSVYKVRGLRQGSTGMGMEVNVFEGTPGESEHLEWMDFYFSVEVTDVRREMLLQRDAFYAAPGETCTAAEIAERMQASVVEYSIKNPDGAAKPVKAWKAFRPAGQPDGELIYREDGSALGIPANALEKGLTETFFVLCAVTGDREEDRMYWGCSVRIHRHEFVSDTNGDGDGRYAGTCNVDKCGKRVELTASLSKTMPYTGNELKPVVTVMAGITKLTKDKDYTVAYRANKNVGTAYADITGKGMYRGVKFSKKFTITKAPISGAAVTFPDVTYTGSPLKPAPTVKFNGKDLKKGTDYTVSESDYKNNTKAGTNTASVTITGMGTYFTGSVTKPFTIKKAPIKKAAVTVVTLTYTGSALEPKVTVKFNGKDLKKGTDYTVSYDHNTKAGTKTASVTITAIKESNFSGTATTKFSIRPAAFSAAKIAAIPAKTYTGNEIKPAPVVKMGSKTLKLNTDYKLAYSNNKNVGTATVTVTAKGNYTGSKKVTFAINPKGTSLQKVTSGSRGFTAFWKKNGVQTTGYELQYSTNKGFTSGKVTKPVANNGTTLLKVTGLKPKVKYFVRVRTYKTVNNKKYYSKWSGVISVTTK